MFLCCNFACQKKDYYMFKGHSILSMMVAGLVLALTSCTGHYKIDGVVETFGYEGRQITLIEYLPFRTTRIDSCIVNRGHFEMKGVVDSTRMVFLCKDSRPIIPIYIEKGHAKVKLLPTEMTVSGTRQNDLFYRFLKKKIDCDNHYEDVSQQHRTLVRSGASSNITDPVQDTLRMIVAECESMICSFMVDNYDEPAAVGIFMMLSGQPTNEIPDLIKRILDAAPDEFLHQSYVSGYIRRMGYERN